MTDIHKEIDSLKVKSGYSGKPQQWQYGFDLACRELESCEKQSQWISVEDKHPSKIGNYLVCVDGVVCDFPFKWVANHWKEFKLGYGLQEDTHGWWHTSQNVTHWMPLPEPPTEECK